VWQSGLKEHPAMEDTLKLMFTAMGEFRLGKSSTIFNNTARDLGNIVLSNKKDQVTHD
jgi:hypothetical protein